MSKKTIFLYLAVFLVCIGITGSRTIERLGALFSIDNAAYAFECNYDALGRSSLSGWAYTDLGSAERLVDVTSLGTESRMNIHDAFSGEYKPKYKAKGGYVYVDVVGGEVTMSLSGSGEEVTMSPSGGFHFFKMAFGWGPFCIGTDMDFIGGKTETLFPLHSYLILYANVEKRYCSDLLYLYAEDLTALIGESYPRTGIGYCRRLGDLFCADLRIGSQQVDIEKKGTFYISIGISMGRWMPMEVEKVPPTFQEAREQDNITAYEDFLKAYPESEFATTVKERIEELREDYFKQALEVDPKYIPPHYELGLIYDKKGDYDKAIEEFSIIANIYTENIAKLLAQEQSEENAKQLEALIKDCITAYDNLTIAYLHKGDKKEAANTSYILGMLFDKIELNKLAVFEFNKGLAIDPSPSFDIYDLLGKLYTEIKDYKQSAESFKKALEINPDSASVHNNLGLAYINQGMQDEARKEFEKAIELDPNFADAHHNLAVFYYEKQDYHNALKEWEEVKRINPEYPNLERNMDLVKEKLKITTEN